MRNLFLLGITPLVAALACGREGATPSAMAPTSPALAGGKASPPTATFYLSNDAAYLLRGDGALAYLEPAASPFAGTSRYRNGEACVSSVVYALGGTGDATMSTGSTGKCARRIRFTYARINADGTTTSEGSLTTSSFLNVRQLHDAATATTPSSTIVIGADSLRTFAFDDSGTRCGTGGNAAIVFAPVRSGVPTGADMVNVHRDAADTWTVSTLPDEVDPVTGQTIHHDKAYCAGNGALYHIPLRFTIRSSTPLAP